MRSSLVTYLFVQIHWLPDSCKNGIVKTFSKIQIGMWCVSHSIISFLITIISFIEAHGVPVKRNLLVFSDQILNWNSFCYFSVIDNYPLAVSCQFFLCPTTTKSKNLKNELIFLKKKLLVILWYSPKVSGKFSLA